MKTGSSYFHTRKLFITGLTSHPNSHRTGLIVVVAVALLFRLLAVWLFPSLHHPDEAFQMFEQAHRFAFGYGIIPWEFTEGIRSVLPPFLVSKYLLAADLLWGGPRGYLNATYILLVCFSLSSVIVVYNMAHRVSPIHGLIVGIVAATWFELVYFSFHPLLETFAANFLIIALALAGDENNGGWRRLAVIGFCLALSLLLRVQLIAGVAVATFWIGRLEFRGRWLPLISGAVLPTIAFAASDWLSWGLPFYSYFKGVWINLVESKASTFGIQPYYWYAIQIFKNYAGALPVLTILVLFRARKSAMWVCVALAIIASHSFIPHKEYRFIFPALACLIVVAAMGAADLVSAMQVGPSSLFGRALFVCGVWIAVSLSLAFSPAYSGNWFKNRGSIESSLWLSDQKGLCGLLLYDQPTAGYAFLHRKIPVYLVLASTTQALPTRAFNFVVAGADETWRFEPEFRTRRCFRADGPKAICAMERPGECSESDLAPILSEKSFGEGPTGMDAP